MEIRRVVLEQRLALLAHVLELAGEGPVSRHGRQAVDEPDPERVSGLELQASPAVRAHHRVGGSRTGGQPFRCNARRRAASPRTVGRAGWAHLVHPSHRLTRERDQALLPRDHQDLERALSAGDPRRFGQWLRLNGRGQSGRCQEERPGGPGKTLDHATPDTTPARAARHGAQVGSRPCAWSRRRSDGRVGLRERRRGDNRVAADCAQETNCARSLRTTAVFPLRLGLTTFDV